MSNNLRLKHIYLLLLLQCCNLTFSSKFGCAFDRSVCSAYEECINDDLFGRCEPSEIVDGRVVVVYRPTEADLIVLRFYLAKLLNAGLTWRDDTTQCVVGTLMTSFEYKLVPDLSVCHPRFDNPVAVDGDRSMISDYTNDLTPVEMSDYYEPLDTDIDNVDRHKYEVVQSMAPYGSSNVLPRTVFGDGYSEAIPPRQIRSEVDIDRNTLQVLDPRDFETAILETEQRAADEAAIRELADITEREQFDAEVRAQAEQEAVVELLVEEVAQEQAEADDAAIREAIAAENAADQEAVAADNGMIQQNGMNGRWIPGFMVVPEFADVVEQEKNIVELANVIEEEKARESILRNEVADQLADLLDRKAEDDYYMEKMDELEAILEREQRQSKRGDTFTGSDVAFPLQMKRSEENAVDEYPIYDNDIALPVKYMPNDGDIDEDGVPEFINIDGNIFDMEDDYENADAEIPHYIDIDSNIMYIEPSVVDHSPDEVYDDDVVKRSDNEYDDRLSNSEEEEIINDEVLRGDMKQLPDVLDMARVAPDYDVSEESVEDDGLSAHKVDVDPFEYDDGLMSGRERDFSTDNTQAFEQSGNFIGPNRESSYYSSRASSVFVPENDSRGDDDEPDYSDGNAVPRSENYNAVNTDGDDRSVIYDDKSDEYSDSSDINTSYSGVSDSREPEQILTSEESSDVANDYERESELAARIHAVSADDYTDDYKPNIKDDYMMYGDETPARRRKKLYRNKGIPIPDATNRELLNRDLLRETGDLQKRESKTWQGVANPGFDSDNTEQFLISITPNIGSQDDAIVLLKSLETIIDAPAGSLRLVKFQPEAVLVRVANNPYINASVAAQEILLHKNEVKELYGIDIRSTVYNGKRLTLRDDTSKPAGRRDYYVVIFAVCGAVVGLLLAAMAIWCMKCQSKSGSLDIVDRDPESTKHYQDLCRTRMQQQNSTEEDETLDPCGGKGKGKGKSNKGCDVRKFSDEPVPSTMDISTGHMILTYMEEHLNKKEKLAEEWRLLRDYEPDNSATDAALADANKRSNRYIDIIPYDHCRVKLDAVKSVAHSDFVNASLITDHDPRTPSYIATQGPLLHTVPDFWQMVWEQKVNTLVMLTAGLEEHGQPMSARYWPQSGNAVYHIYDVHLISEHVWSDHYLVRSFYLKNMETNETRTVTQFHFTKWVEGEVPAETGPLLEFRRKVNKAFHGSHPIVVHCNDGAGRTGAYILIDMVLNRIQKGAKEIDIAATLEHVRDQRMQMVKSQDQFEFSLQAVADEVNAILKALPEQ